VACEDSLIVIDAGSGYTSYAWVSGEITQTILPQTSGTYSVTVVDASGCNVSDSLNVAFKVCQEPEDYTVFVPNAFTPNNDGNNDRFQFYLDEVVFAEIQIYNRWGEKVFETNNANEYWDGTYKGQRCSQGVYLYDIKLVGNNGISDKYKGSVTLLR
jgi:large repetitive protein